MHHYYSLRRSYLNISCRLIYSTAMHRKILATVSKHRIDLLLIITLLSLLVQPGFAEECFQTCSPKGDIPQFCDTGEGRCSLCTTGVCKTSLHIPSECTCFCVLQYASRKYDERDINSCGHIPEAGGQTSREGETQHEKPEEGINGWRLAFVIVVSVLSAIIVGLFIRRNRQCTNKCTWPQKQPQTNDGEAGQELDEICLNSIKVTAPLNPEQPTNDQPQRKPDDTRGANLCLPVQEDTKGDHKESERTGTTEEKEKKEDENDPGRLRHEHATEIGPKYPTEGVPIDYNPCP